VGRTAPEKILFIQTAFLGDVVFSASLLAGLRRKYPEADVTVLASPRGGAVLEGQAFADRVILYDKTGKERGIGALLRLVGRLKQERFDIVVSPHRSLRSGFIARFSGAPRRVGFVSGPAGSAYNEGVPWPLDERVPWRRELRLLKCFGGAGSEDGPPRLIIGRQARRKAAALLARAGAAAGERPLAGFAVGTVWPTKKWPIGHFDEAARRLTEKGVDVVLFGTAGDAENARALAGRKGVINLAGLTSLAELPALVSCCSAFLAVDTGPLHLAMALQVPSVAVFGPTDEKQFEFSPRDRCLTADVSCRPCSAHGSKECPRGNWICMSGVSAEEAVTALEALMAGQGRGDGLSG
jgi:heptosyltransferase-2